MKKKSVLFVMIALALNISAQKIVNGKIEMNINKIEFMDSTLRIVGEFEVVLRSQLDGFYGKEVAKIENGRFEIVI